MSDVQVRGVEQLAALSKALRSADKDLRREAYRALNRTTKPLTQAVKESTGDYLPRSGGYAAAVSSSLRVRTRRRGGRNAGISLKATAKTPGGKARELQRLEQGRLRKPLFGMRGPGKWHDQSVTPGVWSKPLEAEAPAVREALLKVLDDIAQKIADTI